MSHTNIVALFDTRGEADATFRSLVDAGFDDAELEVISDGGWGAGGGYGGLIPQLLGWGVPEDEANAYAEGVRRGGALLVASLTRHEPVERAVAVIRGGGAVSLGERATPPEDVPSPESVESRRTLSDAAGAFRDANAEPQPAPTSSEATKEAGGVHVPPVRGPGTASPSYEPGSAGDVARGRLDRTPPRDGT